MGTAASGAPLVVGRIARTWDVNQRGHRQILLLLLSTVSCLPLASGFLECPTLMKHRRCTSHDTGKEPSGRQRQGHNVADGCNLQMKNSQVIDEAGSFKYEAASLGQRIQKLDLEIDELKGRIKTALSFFAVLGPASYSNELLQEKLDEVPWMYMALSCNQPASENRMDLKELIKELEQKGLRLEDQRLQLQSQRIELLKLSAQQSDGITVTNEDLKAGESGVRYVQATHQIGSLSCENFGLVVKVNDKLQVRALAEMPVAHYDELDEAWLLVQDPEALSTSDQLVKKLPSLDPTFVENAWMMSQNKFQLDPSNIGEMGELAFQQSFHPSFCMLFMAAAGGSNSVKYRADQTVSSSLSVQCKVKKGDDFAKSMVSMQPDAAATLGN
jgi:hypothetical protein